MLIPRKKKGNFPFVVNDDVSMGLGSGDLKRDEIAKSKSDCRED